MPLILSSSFLVELLYRILLASVILPRNLLKPPLIIESEVILSQLELQVFFIEVADLTHNEITLVKLLCFGHSLLTRFIIADPELVRSISFGLQSNFSTRLHQSCAFFLAEDIKLFLEIPAPSEVMIHELLG